MASQHLDVLGDLWKKLRAFQSFAAEANFLVREAHALTPAEPLG
jgi:hypothetical protein